jgi:hypothetical protein
MGRISVSPFDVALTTLLICASYPFALASHAAIDWWLGDGLLLRELQYGSQRLLAAELVRAWVAALVPVLGTWMVLAVLRRVLDAAYPAVVGAASVALTYVALAEWLPVPTQLAYLVLVCAALDALARKWRLARVAA